VRGVRVGNSVEVQLHERPPAFAENDDRNLAARQILLVDHISI
jgi:hypothetical protein